MKNLTFYLLLLLVFAACNKDENPSIENLTPDELAGTWILTEHVVSFVADSVNFEYTLDFSLAIKADGTMTKTSLVNSTTQHYWTKNTDGTIIYVITESPNSNGGIYTSTLRMEIQVDEKDNQLWEETYLSATSDNSVYKRITTWTLERQ